MPSRKPESCGRAASSEECRLSKAKSLFTLHSTYTADCSSRRVTAGLIRDATVAGTQLASRATPVSSNGITVNTSTSSGWTLKGKSLSNRTAASDIKTPRNAPVRV